MSQEQNCKEVYSAVEMIKGAFFAQEKTRLSIGLVSEELKGGSSVFAFAID